LLPQRKNLAAEFFAQKYFCQLNMEYNIFHQQYLFAFNGLVRKSSQFS